MELVHRTNYWGAWLEGRDTDDETGGLQLLWCQAVAAGAPPCCRGFGARSVWLSADTLRDVHDGEWDLWRVSCAEGRSADHLFTKYVLAPSHADLAEWNDDCEDPSEDWWFEGSGRFRSGLGILQAVLQGRLHRRDYAVAHCHVGVLLEEPLFVGRAHRARG